MLDHFQNIFVSHKTSVMRTIIFQRLKEDLWTLFNLWFPCLPLCMVENDLGENHHRITEWLRLEWTLKIISFQPPAMYLDKLNHAGVTSPGLCAHQVTDKKQTRTILLPHLMEKKKKTNSTAKPRIKHIDRLLYSCFLPLWASHTVKSQAHCITSFFFFFFLR